MTDYPIDLIERDGEVICPMCSEPVTGYDVNAEDEIMYCTDPGDQWAAAHGAVGLPSTRHGYMTNHWTFQPCEHEWLQARRHA